jgi:protein-S-isoprenylcysteine O-methyltransferase Ste14
MGMGWLLLTANWFIGPLIAGILLIIVTQVKKEEAMLNEVVGDEYQAYIQRSDGSSLTFDSIWSKYYG